MIISTQAHKIVEVLTGSPALPIKEIFARLDALNSPEQQQYIRSTITRLKKDGVIHQVDRGVYELGSKPLQDKPLGRPRIYDQSTKMSQKEYEALICMELSSLHFRREYERLGHTEFQIDGMIGNLLKKGWMTQRGSFHEVTGAGRQAMKRYEEANATSGEKYHNKLNNLIEYIATAAGIARHEMDSNMPTILCVIDWFTNRPNPPIPKPVYWGEIYAHLGLNQAKPLVYQSSDADDLPRFWPHFRRVEGGGGEEKEV